MPSILLQIDSMSMLDLDRVILICSFHVMKNEEDAAKFFRGGRWNRKQESPNKNSVQMADEGK